MDVEMAECGGRGHMCGGRKRKYEKNDRTEEKRK